MIEITIFGRGGQGGVTLAKLIATTFFLRGKQVQAFGVYAAERSGAPLQAFVRIDDEEITNHNQVRTPDHVIVLDRTLIAEHVLKGLSESGWLVLNTPEAPKHYAQMFPGRNLATIDATSIAVANGLGTKTVPIVNTTILGAVAGVLDLTLHDVEAALEEVKFGGANVDAVRQAFNSVKRKKIPGALKPFTESASKSTPASLLGDEVGASPKIRTGSWATRQPHRQQLTPPCNSGCPAGNNVRDFVDAIGGGDHTNALAILLETSPLPGICGRVCPAPCMEACNRSEYDESVNIRELERYAADHGRWPKPTQPWRDERVAVIGSGPAGLSTTYHLARLGYKVTLFEGDKELGGVLRTGIPAYRLPRDVLDKEIENIIKHGVDVRSNMMIDRNGLLRLSHKYAALFVGTGLQDSRTLNLSNTADDRIEQGIEFLNHARQGFGSLDGQRIIVVGGGNTAIDAARTARRIGAKSVKIVYRRTRAEMPAITEEIADAVDEGVELLELVSPLRLNIDRSGAALTCQRMKLGEPDQSGRPTPVPETADDAVFDITCDRVILALGQFANVAILPEGSDIRNGGVRLGLSGAPIFAGGDFATNEGTVSDAIGSGRKAALHIHRTLTGEDLFPPDPAPVAHADDVTMHVFSHKSKAEPTLATMPERVSTFAEVRRGLGAEPAAQAAVSEANRCFSCGVCNSCDTCVTYCPEGILLRDGDSYRFDYGYCKGCGVCASVCPRGVIYLSEL